MQLAESDRKKSLVNLTPLIDVVFILLIFFMLASNFVRWHVLELATGSTQEITVDSDSLSIVSFGHDGKYTLNGNAMTMNDIVETLNQRIMRQPEHAIIIEPNTTATVQDLMDLIAGINKSVSSDNISVAKSTGNQL